MGPCIELAVETRPQGLGRKGGVRQAFARWRVRGTGPRDGAEADARFGTISGPVESDGERRRGDREIALPEIEFLESCSAARSGRGNRNSRENFTRESTASPGRHRALDRDFARPTWPGEMDGRIQRSQDGREIRRRHGLAAMAIDSGMVEAVIAENSVTGR